MQVVDDNEPTPGRAYAGFDGRVGRTFATSEPCWEPRSEPPPGAPNVIVMLMDDMGFSDFGCYGSEFETPNVDRLAAEGLRFTNHHTTPLCSPSRAALLTGLNHHMAGIGQVVEGDDGDAGYPGYRAQLATDALTMAEIFKANAYVTLAVGKWHVTNEITEGASKDGWPLQRGFDRYHGFMSSPDYWNPHLIIDNHHLDMDEMPEGYYLTDDLTNQAIAMITAAKSANQRRPFFLYFAHYAMHQPHQAKPDDIDKYASAYHRGWDVIRQERFERQRRLGVIPADAVLPPRNTEPDMDVAPWDDLSEAERKMCARHMAVYAAMADNVDQNFGRLRAALERLGEWDNTLIVLASDNGAAGDGGPLGTVNLTYSSVSDFEFDYSFIDELGGPRTNALYPRGWAMVSNTPYRLYKHSTHAGGQVVPLIVSWPGHLDDNGGRRRQFTHVTDVLPTIVDLIGLSVPGERHGVPVKPFQGVSFADALHDPNAPSRHREQYYEMWGNRGYYRSGDEVVTSHERETPFSDDHWELYNLRVDPTQVEDRAAERPELVNELVDAWDRAAWENQVYPLDERVGLNRFRPKAGEELGPVRLIAGAPAQLWDVARLVVGRSFKIDVELDWRPGDQGVLIAYGTQRNGFIAYIEADELRFERNDRGRMSGTSAGVVRDGTKSITIEANADGDRRWRLAFRMDGDVVAIWDDCPMITGMNAGPVNVGIDRLSPVSWALHQRHGCFRYAGCLQGVTIHPGPVAPGLGGVEYFRELREQALRLQ